jgi:hypothetical protein
MAHEFKHYLQYKKGVKKRQHIEPDAEKFAEKVANKLIGLRLITPDNNGLGAKYPMIKVWDACEYIFNLKGGHHGEYKT